MHHELYDVASGIGGISVKRRRLDDGTAETDIGMPSWVINTLVKRVVWAMRGKRKGGASAAGSDPVAIFGSLGVCSYGPASRHGLISYSPIHLT